MRSDHQDHRDGIHHAPGCLSSFNGELFRFLHRARLCLRGSFKLVRVEIHAQSQIVSRAEASSIDQSSQTLAAPHRDAHPRVTRVGKHVLTGLVSVHDFRHSWVADVRGKV